MRVALDEQIFSLQPYGGISRMFASIARQFILDPDLEVELLPLAAPVINRYLLDDEFVRSRLAVWDAGHEYRSLLRYFLRVQPRRGLQVVHNTFYLPHGLASYPGAKRVVTVHDMIPELMPRTRRRLDFLTLKKRYVRTADHIICVSEATRRDMESVYGDLDAPVTVIHHGVDPHFSPDALPVPGLPHDYLLFVGHRGQYKNSTVLLNAFVKVRARLSGMKLVFVGGGPFTRAEVEQHQSLGISDDVLQISLPDSLMPSVYAHAQAFVFPSTFEGFGIPALEAMASGTPTILAKASSLPEVGGNATLFFQPDSAEDLSEAILTAILDQEKRKVLITSGVERAASFSWRKSARATAEVYQSML